jgi:rubredoxin
MRDVLRCPDCKIKQGKFRSKTNDYRCTACGYIYKAEDIKEDNQ